LDGLTLGFVARELHNTLSGGRIDRISQPDKDLVLLMIRTPGENHRLLVAAGPHNTRIHLTQGSHESAEVAPMFLMLLRKHLGGGRILSIRQLQGDRLLDITVSALDEMGERREKHLYFEAMGRHTNFTLVDDGMIIDCARRITDDMSRVRRVMPGLPYEMPPRQDKADPTTATAAELALRLRAMGGRADKALAETISGLSLTTAKEIALRLLGDERALLQGVDVDAFARDLAAFFAELPRMAAPTLLLGPDNVPKDVLPFAYRSLPAELQRPYPTMSQAMDDLYDQKDRHDRLMQRASALRRTLRTAEARCEKKLAAQQAEVDAAGHMEELRVAGELLTAFGHLAQKGAEHVDLPNYYDENRLLRVELDPSLNATANAQRYFKKYRKANVARKVAAEQMERTLEELALISDAAYALERSETSDEINEVKQPLREAGILRREPQKRGKRRERQGMPLSFLSPDGMLIQVGKNSVQNERLLKAAQGNDLWLHAKDVPGSHVIVFTGNKPVQDETLKLALQLAALYSKGRGAGVPVNYTLRKYVKKPAGTPAGYVTFTNEKAVLVTAAESDVASFRVEDKA